MTNRPSHPTPKNRSALLLVIFGVCMVSYSGPMVKGALNAGASPASIATMRMLLAGLFLLPIDLRACAKRRIPFAMSRPQFLWTAFAAAFLAVHYLLWMSSLEGISTFASVALVCTQPLFVAVLSYLLFREVMPFRALPGAMLALLGAALIALSGLLGEPSSGAYSIEGNLAASLLTETLPGSDSIGTNLTASLMALLSAAMMSIHWITARHIRQSLAAEVYTPSLYLLTGVLLAGSLLFMGGFVMPLAALPYMAGLILGSTLLGHAVFSFAIARVSPTVVSFALLGEPVGAMIFAMLFLGEIPTPWVLAGGGLTLAGLCLYLVFTGKAVMSTEPSP